MTLKDKQGRDLELSEVIANHAVIEASAGTGKTYTIEHIVLQILRDVPDVSLRNILLVTYTEKAAGELKTRIRSTLSGARASDDCPEWLRLKLASELDDFDSASISTIHGFCNRVLMEFAFENARPLELEPGNDSMQRARLLADIVRNEWPRIDPTIPNRDGSKSMVAESLDRLKDILAVAGQIRQGDGLLPDFAGDLADARTSDQVAVWTVRLLNERMELERRASSCVTFDDMISDVRTALRSGTAQGKALTELLRGRFAFGVVDEFQDTDPDQWDIFKAVFIEGSGRNRLIVVGDPKQAIYGFRGADLRTYIQARDEIEARGGNILALDTNRRSSPLMIQGFNSLFCIDEWFAPRKKSSSAKSKKSVAGVSAGAALTVADALNPRISCPVLKAPPGADGPGLVADLSGRAAVIPVFLSSPAGGDFLAVDDARYRFADFVAAEIDYLIRKSDIVLPKRNETPQRPLSYDDICILIQKHDDFPVISRLLRKAGIPHAQYKQKKLYESSEASNTLAILRALGKSAADEQKDAVNSVLLGRFFFDGRDYRGTTSPGNVARATAVLATWRELAQQRNWARLFAVMAFDTGLFPREALEFDGERRLANWRQIFGELAGYADSGSLDIHGLTSRLERLRAGDAQEDDSRMNRLESESPKVRILTIHAAKGLEFPVVFVAAGFSSSQSTKWHRGYAAGGRFFQIDEDGATDLAVDDDSARLFYVAMTRAMYKLYVPANWAVGPRARATPVRTFIKDGLDNLMADESTEGTVWSSVDHRGRPIGATAGIMPRPADNDVVTAPVPEPGFDLNQSPELNWRQRRLWIDSYSSLTGYAGRAHFLVEGAAGDRLDDEPEITEGETSASGRNGGDGAGGLVTAGGNYLLPAGRKAGQAFHEVMQEIAGRAPVAGGRRLDFRDVAAIEDPAVLMDGPVGRVIRQKMARQGLANRLGETAAGLPDSAELQFARLVLNALRTPLGTAAGLDFRMCDVASADTVPELEFHLDESDFGISGESTVPEWRRGLLNGFIDLVFRREGRFWFLDWKTTTIGAASEVQPGSEQWSGRALELAMVEHRYIVQAHVYRIAMLRWLAQRYGDRAGDFFGGGLFLFMRGMVAPGQGVWNSLKTFDSCPVGDSYRFVGELLAGSAADFGGGGRN